MINNNEMVTINMPYCLVIDQKLEINDGLTKLELRNYYVPQFMLLRYKQ